jgi:outer membrane protein assembly factor BamB
MSLQKPLCMMAFLAVFFAASVCFGQSISLSPNGGPPTVIVKVSGSGFSPNAAIDIYFDTKDEGLAVANGSGAFSNVQIKALRSAVPGEHWVSAVQRSGDTGAQSPFWVHTDWKQLGLNAAHAQWNSYENVISATTVRRLALQWMSTLSGLASVAGNRVYLASGDNVYALNAATGHVLWQSATGGLVLGTPAVEGNHVYVSSDDFNVYALLTSDGSVAWKFATGAIFSAEPVVANGIVYAASDDDNVYALNAADGTLLWKFTTGGPIQFTPSVYNGIVYVASSDGNIYALGASSGTVVWTYTTTPSNNLSTPSVVNGVVYVASADSNMYALNSSNGSLLWKASLGAPADGSLAAVANGVVYVGSGDAGVFYALDANTGAVRWQYTTLVPVYSASAVANGIVYFGDGSGYFYGFDAATGKLLWRYTTGGFFPSAVVTDGRIFITSTAFYVLHVPSTNGVSVKPPDLHALHTTLAMQ